ncbi:hypothetical protein ACFYUV_38100 [Nonomuraea sp. NPDC003560]|uniref:hypothetical protein n=1 Tax=Nonomuraea sp. NPDC003560 TaxID=3364341 RepID=UPI0036ABBCA1
MATPTRDTASTASGTAPDAVVFLTREQILSVDDRREEQVHVPEWGGTVIVRGLSGTQRDKYEGSLLDSKNRVRVLDARGKLAQMSIVDQSGQLLFGEEDIKALSRKSAKALSRVVDVAQRLSGLSDEDLEELEGN